MRAEDDEDDVLTDVLIAYPMAAVGLGVMASGAGFLMGDAGIVQTSKKATSARQPSILSPPTNTPTVSEVMQQVPVAIRLATIENSIGMKLVLIPTGKFMLSRSVSEVVPRDIAGNNL